MAKTKFKKIKSKSMKGMQTKARPTKNPYPKSAKGGKARSG